MQVNKYVWMETTLASGIADKLLLVLVTNTFTLTMKTRYKAVFFIKSFKYTIRQMDLKTGVKK